MLLRYVKVKSSSAHCGPFELTVLFAVRFSVSLQATGDLRHHQQTTNLPLLFAVLHRLMREFLRYRSCLRPLSLKVLGCSSKLRVCVRACLCRRSELFLSSDTSGDGHSGHGGGRKSEGGGGEQQQPSAASLSRTRLPAEVFAAVREEMTQVG